VAEQAIVHRFGLPIPRAPALQRSAAIAVRLAPRADLVHAHRGEDLAVLLLS
jgi:hypothetical protein